MKKKMLAAIAAASPLGALAQSAAQPTDVAPAVTQTITDLQTAATNYAGAILPYIAAVGLAFIGITVVYLLFKVFKRFVGGR